ncbi:galanin peptides-like isoform X1 [Hemibagrus wyckioides]|uniref:galanin peptides-like isoform X1 n=1 Tax=Hemibagrus wyckioides TaxID=337641 RepID=UPI00266D5846|nr:galanin peptides-like isoform X1 [Hemibagrus wyckioides]
MQMSYMLFWVSLCVLSPQLSQTHGMRLRGLEKRGWTLNSAGYLLGPSLDLPKSSHPDAHRTLTVRHGGSVGKRESTEDFVLPTPQPSYNESYLHALIEFLTYLRMKDNKSIEEVISSTFTDDGT